MASKFKEKIKKEKELNKKNQENIITLQNKINKDKNEFDLYLSKVN